jgi:hypothetical protein
MLHAAVPEPSRPLDMSAIHRRARLRGWRRVMTWVAGAGAVLVAGIGISDSLVLNTNEGGRTGGGDAQRPATVDQTRTEEAPAGVATRSGTARRSASGSGKREGAASTPAPTTTIAVDEFPPRDSCSVDTAGLAVNQSRQCSFTATEKGGASMESDAPASSYDTQSAHGEVFVTRDGKRTSEWNSDDCGFKADAGEAGVFAGNCIVYVVQPGDRVEVVITKTRDDPFVVTLGAGKGW